MRLSRTGLLSVLGVVAILAIGAGFFAREPLERAIFQHAVSTATGVTLDAQWVERAGDGYDVHGLRATAPGGGVVVDAPRAYLEVNGNHLTAALERPHFTLDLDRFAGVQHAFAGTSLDVHVSDGSLTVVAGTAAQPVLGFDALAGAVRVRGPAMRFDLTLALVDAGQRYPIAAHSTLDPSGADAQAWSAAELPLAPFANLLDANSALRFTTGTLADLAVVDGAGLHATARLEHAATTLGSHKLSGVHGPLVLDGGGIGSSGLAGTLDGTVPIDGAGEVHDLTGRYAWLQTGSLDLTDLDDLIATIAGEPQLRSVRVETTAPGLTYAQYALGSDHGPLAISVLAIEPREPTLHFNTAIAEDHVISGGERTSSMGVRTGAVGGVNGDYFDIGRTYQPQGLLMRSGSLLRGPTDRAALAIDASGHVTFAEFHLNGVVDVGGRRFAVTQFNNWPPGPDRVTVITPGYGKMLSAAPGVTFAALDSLGGDGRRYRVRDVSVASAPMPVTFGLAFGPGTRAPLRPGQTVRLTYRLDPPVPGAVAAIGGGPILIKDGAWYEDPHAPAPDERDFRWPVVALARKADDRLLLVAVDGRHPERSVGMTRPEFGDLLLRLGATDAMALDSGGSVTLVSRAPGDTNVTVRNVPSDNSAERWVSDALFLYSTAPPPTIVAPSAARVPVPEARPSP
jgi:exopolysaccharide biosynthesis protein